MRVSHPEIQYLLNKVFTGCGVPLGYAEELAEMASWGVFAGVFPLDRIIKEIPQLENGSVSGLNVTMESHGFVNLDADQTSSLISGTAAIDLAVDKANEAGEGIVRVTGSQGNLFLISNAYCVGERGMSCIIKWRENGYQYMAVSSAASSIPTVWRGIVPKVDESGFVVICSKRLQITVVEEALAETEEVLSAERIKQTIQNHIRDGCEIDADHYSTLNQLAQKVLVAPSEISRIRGAGEQAH